MWQRIQDDKAQEKILQHYLQGSRGKACKDEMGRQQPQLCKRVYERVSKERTEQAMKVMRCPHCMGTARLYCNYSRKVNGYFVFVKCDICGAQGKTFVSNEDPSSDDVQWNNQTCVNAVKAWNMRNGESYAED